MAGTQRRRGVQELHISVQNGFRCDNFWDPHVVDSITEAWRKDLDNVRKPWITTPSNAQHIASLIAFVLDAPELQNPSPAVRGLTTLKNSMKPAVISLITQARYPNTEKNDSPGPMHHRLIRDSGKAQSQAPFFRINISDVEFVMDNIVLINCCNCCCILMTRFSVRHVF